MHLQNVHLTVKMASSTAVLFVAILGAVCLANAMPARMQRDAGILDHAVDAALFLRDTLRAQRDALSGASPETSSRFEKVTIQMQAEVLNEIVEAAEYLYDHLKQQQDAVAGNSAIQWEKYYNYFKDE